MPDGKPLTLLDFREPEEVSVVDQAANKRKFPIWKNKEALMPTTEEILQAVIDQELGDENALNTWVSKAKLSEKGAAAVRAAVRILSGFKDELPGDIMTKLSELTGMAGPAEMAKKKEDKEVKKDKALEPVAKALAGLPEEVRKALDEEKQARELEIKALRESNEKVSKALADEKDARDLAGWVERTKTELSHYPGESSEEIAKDLHSMNKADPDLTNRQFEKMKRASDALKGSEIFKSAGSARGQSPAGAWEEIEKMADGMVEKASGPMSKSQAIACVLKTKKGAELYERYEQEQEGV